MNQVILNLITTYSMLYGVDPNMTLSIVKLESQFNQYAVGSHGELGLMQLRPEYFSESCKKGYNVPVPLPAKLKRRNIPCGQELFTVETNLRIGIKNLAQVMASCSHKKDGTWVLCHNLGVKGGARIKRPKEFAYYRNVMANYQEFSRLYPRPAPNRVASLD